MPLPPHRSWALCALGVCLLSASCAPDNPVTPGAGTLPVLNADLDGRRAQFYVSPAGLPSGDGSRDHPWDLATALSGPAALTPGSTIWLRGGTYLNPADPRGYISTLAGTADAPIVVRQYPGERATVTSTLVARGAYTWYWGFELTNPAPQQEQPLHGLDLRGPGTKAINLVIHDATEDGVFIGPEAVGAEVTGSIVYNNGRVDNLTHGIYCKSAGGTLLLEDNIVFDNWASGFHCYANDGPYIQHIDLEGNVAFNNYIWGVPWDTDILVGGVYPATGITVNENYTYRSSFANTQTADIGSDVVTNQDLVCTNNYFVGGWWRLGAWTTATVRGNALFNFTTGGMMWTLGDLSGQAWSDNIFFGDSAIVAWRHDSTDATTFNGWRAEAGLVDPGGYGASAPTEMKVVVRPNRYEHGRANIIIYNWAQQNTATVDVSGILNVGDRYVVRNAEDFYGPPVADSSYTGGPLQLPIASVTPPSPVGVTTPPAPATGPTFNVYVLMKVWPSRCNSDEGERSRCTGWPARGEGAFPPPLTPTPGPGPHVRAR